MAYRRAAFGRPALARPVTPARAGAVRLPDKAGVVVEGDIAAAPTPSGAAGKLALPVTLFLIAQLVPWVIMLGSMRISIYRLVLMVMIIPCLVMWFSGRAGRIRLADICILAYALWCAVAITVVHGASYALQSAGMIFIESVGSYFLARCFIRSADDFYRMTRLLFLFVVVMLPLAAFESFTGRDIARDFLGMFYPTFPDAPTDPRWGLRRAQVVYEHPILFGVCTASILALVHLVLGYGNSTPRRWLRSGVVIGATFFSLSAGPLAALAAQFLLLVWNGTLRFIQQRWKILVSFAFAAAVVLELFSNRSLPSIFISYFSFDEGSARTRLNIWEYGTIAVMNKPLFGAGFFEWERPSWMTPSIDMFWLIDAIRHGIPAEVFMLATFFATVLPVALKRVDDERVSTYRTAYVISMTGLFLAGWTVYFWNATFVLVIFLLGSGVWIRDVPDPGSPEGKRRRRDRAFPADTQNYGTDLRLSRRGRSIAGTGPGS